MLESGEFSHSGSGEKRQFWSKEKSQHMEAVLIMVTAGAGMLDVLLEEASFNLGLLMRS